MAMRGGIMMAAVASAAALMLTGCGGGDERTVASGTVTDDDGKQTSYRVTQSGDGDDGQVTIKTDEGEMRFGSGAANAKMPDGFTLFPGATLTGGMTGGADGKTATIANFEAKGKMADVIAFYRKQVERQGMKVMGEMSTPESVMLTAQQEKPVKRSVQITAAQDGDQVNGAVMAQSGD